MAEAPRSAAGIGKDVELALGPAGPEVGASVSCTRPRASTSSGSSRACASGFSARVDAAFADDLAKAPERRWSGEAGGARARSRVLCGRTARGPVTARERSPAQIVPNGAIWTLRTKGQRAVTEADTMAAGKAAGLVDVKVVSFSETMTAEKFVIPVARRPTGAPTPALEEVPDGVDRTAALQAKTNTRCCRGRAARPNGHGPCERRCA